MNPNSYFSRNIYRKEFVEVKYVFEADYKFEQDSMFEDILNARQETTG
jgi:hypothetical protein